MKVSGLSEPRSTILKIGGSVITDKNADSVVRTEEISRLAGEIHKANVKNLVIVHGGGSFGHPVARRYRIKDGFKEDSQRIGFAETHNVMAVLNGFVMDSLILHSIPAVSITPSTCIVTENGRIKSFQDDTLKTLLKMGFTPVLYGDAVLDTKLGFTILSGDQLVSMLGTMLNAERIVVGVDVDGLYEADPRVDETAKVFKHLTLEELKEFQRKLDKPSVCDVTGGMLGKVTELIPALERGIPVTIVNALKPKSVYGVLKGEPVEGTVIEKE